MASLVYQRGGRKIQKDKRERALHGERGLAAVTSDNNCAAKVHPRLRQWITDAQRGGVEEFVTFANGLTADLQAVRAALEYEWSKGQVEGQVHRLKLVKRQMYGRGKLNLLRARVLYAA